MKIEQIKSDFNESYESVITPISESLNQLCGHTAQVEYEIVEEEELDNLLESEDLPRVFITFECNSDAEWSHWFSMPPQLVANIYAWMIGGEGGGDLEDEHLEGMQEAVNQIFGQLETFLEVQDKNVEYEKLNIIKIDQIADLPDIEYEGDVLGVEYKLKIAEETYPINHYFWTESSQADESIRDDSSNMTEKETKPESQVQVNPAEFEDFGSDNNNSKDPRNLDMLMDVQLEAIVELGRKTIPIKDVLKLGKGSIIELDKNAGESLDIFINGRKLAEGEVVVVDEQFGIRITHLLEPKERIKSLQ